MPDTAADVATAMLHLHCDQVGTAQRAGCGCGFRGLVNTALHISWFASPITIKTDFESEAAMRNVSRIVICYSSTQVTVVTEPMPAVCGVPCAAVPCVVVPCTGHPQ
jgi:hypothetical protein